jgi:hypothetical protein
MIREGEAALPPPHSFSNLQTAEFDIPNLVQDLILFWLELSKNHFKCDL